MPDRPLTPSSRFKRLFALRATRLVLLVLLLSVVGLLLWWRGPDWGQAAHAFAAVRWWWVVGALALNLASVAARSLSWQTIVSQSLPERPRFQDVFSAFCVGLGANALLPGRVGEVARIWALRRHLRPRRGLWASLGGTVVAHRALDLFPSLALVAYVLVSARLPAWARGSLWGAIAVGVLVFLLTFLFGKRQSLEEIEQLGRVKSLIAMGRQGLSVMRRPRFATLAALFQILGWLTQLMAVYAALRAFNIDRSLAAAAVVLVLLNLAILFPLWPGNVGLVQAAVALPLKSYGVAYAHGFAFGIGLQAIEASVGISLGLLFLAKEGLSLAQVREIDEALDEVGEAEPDHETDHESGHETETVARRESS